MLPYLTRFNERSPSALHRLADLMDGEDDYMESETRRLYSRFVTRENDFHSWSAEWFAGVHVALQRRLIKLILNYLSAGGDSMDFLKVEQIRRAVLRPRPGNLTMDIGLGIRFTREYDRAALHSMVVPPAPFDYEISRETERLDIPEARAAISLHRYEGPPHPPGNTGPLEAWFDADAVVFPLRIRSRRPGDRMELLGLNGSKKVKDMFIDAKLSPALRERIPIVTDAEGRILWAAGIRRSAAALVTTRTERSLQLKLFMPDLDRSACEDT
ncbi:tRNA lysidine(34) synthetase TilS [Paenibacillus sp. P26]|nr:tRNA lysidine(34) synthetase TilS [Paenibacillus sp. P26]